MLANKLLSKEIFKLAKPGPYTIWHVLNLLALGFMGGSIIFGFFFNYQYIYRTLDSANSIILLNPTSNIESVDLAGFQKIEEALAAKQNLPTIPPTLRNLFLYVSSTLPTVISATSTFINTSTPNVPASSTRN